MDDQGSNLGVGKDFFNSKTFIPGHGTLFQGHQDYFPRVKRLGRDVVHSPPSGIEIKNHWSYTSTPLTYLNGVGRDNSTAVIIIVSFAFLFRFLYICMLFVLYFCPCVCFIIATCAVVPAR